MERKQSKIFLGTLLALLMGFTWNISWAQTPCGGYSTLDCSEIVVPLPYQARFNNYDVGMPDKNGIATGFTMVATASNPTPAAPNTGYSNPSLPGYEPNELEVVQNTDLTYPNQLKVTAYAGKNYQTGSGTNNQHNQLGVGVQAQGKRLLIDTYFESNSTALNWAQMGIWYGIDDDNFVKLIISHNKVQFVLERDDNGTIKTNVSQADLAPFNYTDGSIRLIIEVDYSRSQPELKGYYQLEGQAMAHINTFNHDFSAGVTLPDGTSNVSFAGIHVTSENRPSFEAVYEYFKVTEIASVIGHSLEPTSLFRATNWVKPLPYTLDFNSDANGLEDKNGKGTGFTMIAPAKNYQTADGVPSYAGVFGFEPADLEINAGVLKTRTKNGSSYANRNEQVNMLGVGTQSNNQIFQIEAQLKLNSQSAGNNQGGIWYGWDQDNFMKLVIVNQKIEFSFERNGITAPGGFVRSNKIDGVHLETVRFILRIDNITGRVQAYYQVLTGVNAGSLTLLKDMSQDLGTGVTPEPGISGVSFAGIMFSDETGPSFTADYDYFKITSDYWAVADGNWANANIWSFGENDPPMGVGPGPNSRIFIKGHQVTVDANTDSEDITLIDVSALTPTKLTVQPNQTLTVKGEVKLQRSSTSGANPNCQLLLEPTANLQTNP